MDSTKDIGNTFVKRRQEMYCVGELVTLQLRKYNKNTFCYLLVLV